MKFSLSLIIVTLVYAAINAFYTVDVPSYLIGITIVALTFICINLYEKWVEKK